MLNTLYQQIEKKENDITNTKLEIENVQFYLEVAEDEMHLRDVATYKHQINMLTALLDRLMSEHLLMQQQFQALTYNYVFYNRFNLERRQIKHRHHGILTIPSLC